MKFLQSLLLMSLLGSTACVTAVVIGEPYRCQPIDEAPAALAQYKELRASKTAPRLRAWVREADRVCRANNALRAH